MGFLGEKSLGVFSASGELKKYPIFLLSSKILVILQNVSFSLRSTSER